MASLQPIVLFGNPLGPNPNKVAIILEELAVPYVTEIVELRDVKSAPLISINPNGRIPAIKDPNANITLWESGVIVQYLIDTYDTAHKLSYASSPEKYELLQWLMFQVCGQGSYFGQAVWFSKYHHEKLPSSQQRYLNEIDRVPAVLDN